MHDSKIEKFLSWAVPGPTRQTLPPRVRLAEARRKLARISLRLGFLLAWISSAALGVAAALAILFALTFLAAGSPRESWEILRVPKLASWVWLGTFLGLCLCGKLWFRYRERFSDQTDEAIDRIAARISGRAGRSLSSAARAEEALRDLGELEQVQLWATGNLLACWVTVYAVSVRLDEIRKRLESEIEQATAEAGYDTLGWLEYDGTRPEE